jgi:hypothetical protein
MADLYNFVDAQRLLIKPFDRVRFIVIFGSATAICSAIASYFWPQLICYAIGDSCWAESALLPGLSPASVEYSIVTKMFTGISIGVTIGLVQSLMLRRYLSAWKWLLAVSMGFTILSLYQAASSMWLSSYLSSNTSRSGDVGAIALPIIFYIVGTVSAVVISGYLQWYVLRPEVRQARWWIFLPLIAAIVGGIPIVLKTLSSTLSLYSSSPNLLLPIPPFNTDFIKFTMLPAIQALGFCALNRKSLDDRPILQTPLAVATDITNYWEIRRIKKALENRISRIWKTGLEPTVGKLIYLVGVDRTGTQIAYEPIDRTSSDNIDLTPLPELVESSKYATEGVDRSTAFAKFQVVLAPPGTVEIKSWRGIPLKWLAAVIYLSIMGLSLLVTMVSIQLFPLPTN